MFFKKKKNNEYDSYEDDIYENEETIDSYGETDYNSNNYDETEIDEVIEVDETNENSNSYLDEYQEYNDGIDFYKQFFCSDYIPCIANILFKTNLLKVKGGFIDFPLAIGSDDATTLSLSKYGVVNTKDILFSFRVSGINLSDFRNANPKNLAKKMKAINLFSEWISKDFANIMKHNSDTNKIKDKTKWKTVKALLYVKIQREENDELKVTDNYYIFDYEIDIEEAEKVIRDHWNIECGLHWKLDVILDEDHSRNREGNSINNLAILRKIIFNLASLDNSFGKITLTKKLTRYKLNYKNIERLIFDVIPSVS